MSQAGEDLSGPGMGRLLLWLADGAFSAGSKRRLFLESRVYMEAADRDLRPALEQAGFSVVCLATPDRLHKGPVRTRLGSLLSMDALEIALTRRDIREVVILSTDPSLIGLVNRLQPLQLRVVTCGRLGDGSYDRMGRFADVVIHMAALREGLGYQRTPRKWYQLRSPAPAPVATAGRAQPSVLVRRVRDALSAGRQGAEGGDAQLAQAADLLEDLGRLLPDQPLARVSVMRALAGVSGFTSVSRKGVRPWLGQKSYPGLLRRLAALRPCLEVEAAGPRDVRLVWRPALAAASVLTRVDPSADAPPDTQVRPDAWARLSETALRPGHLSGAEPSAEAANGGSIPAGGPQDDPGR